MYELIKIYFTKTFRQYHQDQYLIWQHTHCLSTWTVCHTCVSLYRQVCHTCVSLYRQVRYYLWSDKRQSLQEPKTIHSRLPVRCCK